MSAPRCAACNRTLAAVGYLKRLNAKGIPGVWGCEECYGDGDELGPDPSESPREVH